MASTLRDTYERDRRVWDDCAETYEQQIVEGHPDVTAYEAFEEDLLDRLLSFLIRERGADVHLYDVGCGSARLHLRYGLKTCDGKNLPEEERLKVRSARRLGAGFQFDATLARGLKKVGGVDFSAEMIRLAERKMAASGLSHRANGQLYFEEGSAFELKPMAREPLPVAVSVCNSVGVMQGPDGAVELFKSMRRAVESAGGIAIISGYRAEAVGTFALGNYESTMNVCGQPRWLQPDEYAGPEYIKVPKCYKRAHDPDPSILVDVYDRNGTAVERDYRLERDPGAVSGMLENGHILTHTDYESHWYSFEQFGQWISDHWPVGKAYHLEGKVLDALRAEPVQLAVLDCQGHLAELLKRWNV